MRFVSDFADQAVILPVAVAVAFVLLLAGWRRGALAWTVAVAGTLAAVLIAKILIHACIGATIFPDLRSPSGHTASAAVVYGGLISLLLPGPLRGVRRVFAALLLGAAFAFVFGETRLALHAHTVADVLAGACMGIAGALGLARFAGPRPPGLRAELPVAAVLAIVVLLHGTHLHAEEAIDQLSCRIWPTPLAAAPAYPPVSRPYASSSRTTSSPPR